MSAHDWSDGAPRLIGIVGRKRAGKDTVAGVLVREAGFERVGFADALKEELASLLGVTVGYVEEHKSELRLALQLRGTEFWRSRDKEHWIRELAFKARGTLARGGRVVVPDVRFVNEAKWIKSNGGILVRVIRRDREPGADDHASETEQDTIREDYRVNCPTGVSHVKRAAKAFLNWLTTSGSRESKGRIYVAGPMRGHRLLNFPAFDAARDALRGQGWDVISPADEDRKEGFDPARDGVDGWKNLGWTEDSVLARDGKLLRHCVAIALLPGWKNSRGVTLHELPTAVDLGLDVYEWDQESRTLKKIGWSTKRMRWAPDAST